MRCVIQRVRRASVSVNDAIVASIDHGLLVLAAVQKGDIEHTMRDAAKKIRELRIFSDDAGKMNRDLADVRGSILAVSQFTLAGSIERGRRPSFDEASVAPIFHWTSGIPRRVNVLCNRLLLSSYLSSTDEITGATVDSVGDEMRLELGAAEQS